MYTVLVTQRWGFGGESYEEQFETEKQVRSFCREEVKWESCAMVECPELDIHWTGDFA